MFSIYHWSKKVNIFLKIFIDLIVEINSRHMNQSPTHSATKNKGLNEHSIPLENPLYAI